MAPKFYAPSNWDCLTISRHPGTLTRSDMVENLMRMLLMQQENLSAEQAISRLTEMPDNRLADLRKRATEFLDSPDMQKYLEMKPQASPGTPLLPITEVLGMENPEEANQWLMQELDNWTVNALEQWEFPQAEWD